MHIKNIKERKLVLLLVFSLMLVFIISCTDKSDDNDIRDEEAIKMEFEDVTEHPSPVIEPIDISDDPKKQEVMGFVQWFISTIKFPEVGGYPAEVIKSSFKFVGFSADGNKYRTRTQFRLMTMEGPIDKQFYIVLEENEEGNFKILQVVEDK